MRFNSRSSVKNLLNKFNIRTSRHLGQNFLVNEKMIDTVVSAGQLGPSDLVLEIGPGIGNLTQKLAEKAKRVVALEKDERMVEVLKETLADLKNVAVIQGDALQAKILFNHNYKAVGNLPFYITSPLIRRFLESVEIKPDLMVFLVQKEVGQRICAQPPDMSLLAVAVQIYAKVEIISYVPKKSFWPEPKVNGAIIRITPDAKPIGDKDLFFKIVKAGFSQPRKQLINNLSNSLKIDKVETGEWLLKGGVQPTQRAETLSMDEWIELVKSYKIN
ncbi:MAG: 16S rRNA (adenine(1518)-N(6)/adenine(1519)-N(6))-dimethyltransferase RsmA [Candidatus Nealsonbacteria bacterium]